MEPPAGESRAKAAPTTGLTEGSPRRHFENVIRHLQIGTGDLVEHNVKRNDRTFSVLCPKPAARLLFETHRDRSEKQRGEFWESNRAIIYIKRRVSLSCGISNRHPLTW